MNGTRTAEAGCRSEHRRSRWPEGRAAGAASFPGLGTRDSKERRELTFFRAYADHQSGWCRMLRVPFAFARVPSLESRVPASP
jgi:hypothetical protein